MVQGLPTSQVASRLYLAPKTIRNRVSDMLGKLGVGSREEAVEIGRAAGLGRPTRLSGSVSQASPGSVST